MASILQKMSPKKKNQQKNYHEGRDTERAVSNISLVVRGDNKSEASF